VAATKSSVLRQRAMAAAYALLGIVPAAQAQDKKVQPPATPAADHWTYDSSFLYYNEAERISVLEPQFGVRKDYSDGRAFSILATVDSISGNTPIGTLPATANTANTVTGASGRNYQTTAGKTPLSYLRDTRVALDASWLRPLSQVSARQLGINGSMEKDFYSIGLNGKYLHDYNQKNTTLSLGLAPEFDIVSPSGGLPVGFATKDTPGSIDGSQNKKWLLSGLAGITQVINRKLLMQFNTGMTYEQGYLTDPYKQLSLVNAQGDPVFSIYEKRPTDRLEGDIYWLTRYNLYDKDVASLALRFYTDDWGIQSQTIDFTYRRQSTDRFYWQPHVRWYHQSAAGFFHVGLLNGAPLPDNASADLRLADLHGVTFGAQFGYLFHNNSELILRGEYYMETGESKPKEAIGAQRQYDLFPTLYATIVQLEYRFNPSTLFKKNR
jgi:hypothetical protein